MLAASLEAGGRWVDRSMEMRRSQSQASLNIPVALPLGGWGHTEAGMRGRRPRVWGGRRGAEEGCQANWEAGREMTWLFFFFLSSSEQGLLCPQEPLGSLSRNRRAATQAGVACLGLGCDGKQEAPVISQEGLTVGREPADAGRPPRWGRKVWPGLQNIWLQVVLWVG